jgi:FKBP-type peptidyl-prolyl cis-trans isomerase FkpA
MKTIRRKAVAGLVLAAVVGLAGCGDDPFQVIEETEFAASLGIDLDQMEKLPSGVYFQDIELGTGDELVYDSDVFITYTGWLADGTEFDSGSFGFQVQVGGGAIEGLNLGLLGMQQGGTRKLVIPPALAYGDKEVGIIPPGSILVFEVTLDDLTVP